VGVELMGMVSTYPPPPNPFPAGEGELLRPTFCKVSVGHDTRLPMAVRGKPVSSHPVNSQLHSEGRESAPPPAVRIILLVAGNVIVCRPFKANNTALHAPIEA
jgi:hypothetical protein